MKAFCSAALVLGLMTVAAPAQQLPNSTPQQSYISVMSKAGTPLPRPPVPNRNVALPAGAAAGYGYYYGHGGYRAGAGGAPAPSYADVSAPSSSRRTLPGYDTRPGRSSSAADGFNYGSTKRRR